MSTIKKPVLFFGLIFFLILIFLDTLIDEIFVFPGGDLIDLLFFHIPTNEIYSRILIFIVVAILSIYLYFLQRSQEKAYNEIKQSEEGFFKIFNENPIAILIVKKSDHKIVKANKIFEKVTGYKREDIIGKTTKELRLWHDEGLRDKFYSGMLVNGFADETEMELINISRNIINLLISGTAIDYKGQSCLITFGRNITEIKKAQKELEDTNAKLEQRVQERTKDLEQANIELELINNNLTVEIFERSIAEKALRESEEKYRSLLNQIPIGVYRTTVDGRFLEASPALASILGCTNIEELFCTSVFDYYESKDTRYEHIERLKSMDNVFQDEIKLVTKQGKHIWVRDKGRFVYKKNGEIDFIDGILEDITNKRNIEQSLYWYASINSTLADISKIVITSTTLSEITYEILEKAYYHTGSRFGLIGLLDTDNPELQIECLINESGNEIDIEGKSYPVRNLKGLIGSICEIGQSLILNPQAENLVKYSLINDEYNVSRAIASPAKVGDKLYGLIIMAESLNDYTINELEVIERMGSLLAVAVQRFKAEEEIHKAVFKEHEFSRLKSGFVTMVSHEYRTPLQAILLITQLLKEYKDKLTDEDREKYLSRIQQSVNTMNNLIEDIISLNKFDLGKADYEPKEIDINSLCKSIIDEVTVLSENKCEINYKFSGNWKVCFLDEKMIWQLLTTLLSNSVKYSFDNSKINFFVDMQDDSINFEIQDFGIGITEMEKKNIFQPFFRGINTGVVSGSGLGLSIAKHVVDFLGGKLDFTSEENVGTTFVVNLPLNKTLN